MSMVDICDKCKKNLIGRNDIITIISSFLEKIYGVPYPYTVCGDCYKLLSSNFDAIFQPNLRKKKAGIS